MQPFCAVLLGGVQTCPSKVLLDDRVVRHIETLLFLNDQAGEWILLNDLHQLEDVLRMVGHAVEQFPIPPKSQLAIQSDGAVKGEQIL